MFKLFKLLEFFFYFYSNCRGVSELCGADENHIRHVLALFARNIFIHWIERFFPWDEVSVFISQPVLNNHISDDSAWKVLEKLSNLIFKKVWEKWIFCFTRKASKDQKLLTLVYFHIYCPIPKITTQFGKILEVLLSSSLFHTKS